MPSSKCNSQLLLLCCLWCVLGCSMISVASAASGKASKAFIEAFPREARSRKYVIDTARLYDKLSSVEECDASGLKYFLRVLNSRREVLKSPSRTSELGQIDRLFYPLMLPMSSKCKVILDRDYLLLEKKLDSETKSRIDLLFKEYGLNIYKDKKGFLSDMLRRSADTWSQYERLVEAKDASNLANFLRQFYETYIVIPCKNYRHHFEDWYYKARPLKFNLHPSLVADFGGLKYLQQLDTCEFYQYQGNWTVDMILEENGLASPSPCCS